MKKIKNPERELVKVEIVLLLLEEKKKQINKRVIKLKRKNKILERS